MNLSFRTHPSDEDENVPPGTPPAEMVRMLALRKASSVAAHYGEGVVIGSDTIVVCDDEIMGKPADEQDACRMLGRLSGRAHQVYTGVAIVVAGGGRSRSAYSQTEVFMKAMDEDRIRRYVLSGEPMDKAGSYGIQGLGAALVEKIDGDFFTVMGLPVALLADMLEEFGIRVL